MAITEQEILKAIAEAELEQKEARGLVAFHKKAAVDAESRLIAANLHREKLAEDLRVWHNTTVKHELDARDREIEAFRAKMEDFKKRGLL